MFLVGGKEDLHSPLHHSYVLLRGQLHEIRSEQFFHQTFNGDDGNADHGWYYSPIEAHLDGADGRGAMKRSSGFKSSSGVFIMCICFSTVFLVPHTV